METPGPRLEPAFQGGPLPSLGKDEDPVSTRGSGVGFVDRSERWRRLSTSQRIRRLRVDRDEKVLPRTGEEPFNGALVRRSRTPDEPIIPMIDTLDVELLPRFDTVHPPELGRQNDLALGRDGGLRAGKIPSYLPRCQALRPGGRDQHR